MRTWVLGLAAGLLVTAAGCGGKEGPATVPSNPAPMPKVSAGGAGAGAAQPGSGAQTGAGASKVEK